MSEGKKEAEEVAGKKYMQLWGTKDKVLAQLTVKPRSLQYLVETVHRSRTAVLRALHSLRDEGLVFVSDAGVWDRDYGADPAAARKRALNRYANLRKKERGTNYRGRRREAVAAVIDAALTKEYGPDWRTEVRVVVTVKRAFPRKGDSDYENA